MPEETPQSTGGLAVADAAPGSEQGTSATTPRTEASPNAASTVDAPKDAKENTRAVDAPRQGEAPGTTPEATTGEAPETLTTEERYRREAQREKDLRYAAEQRALKSEEQIKRIDQDRQRAQAQQLTQQQQSYFQNEQARINRQEQAYADLYNRVIEAEREEDNEQAAWLASQAQVLYDAIEDKKRNLSYQYQQSQQQFGALRAQEQEQTVNGILSEHGYTMKELTAFNPKLDKLNYFDVLKTVASYERQQAETKAEAKYKVEVDKLKAAQARLDTEHPGSRVEGGRTGGAGNGLSIKVGNTDAWLEKAFSSKK